MPRTKSIPMSRAVDPSSYLASQFLTLPRFGGGGKRGVYSTEGGRYAKATKDLHTGVQTRIGAARQEQRQTDEPDCARIGSQ